VQPLRRVDVEPEDVPVSGYKNGTCPAWTERVDIGRCGCVIAVNGLRFETLRACDDAGNLPHAIEIIHTWRDPYLTRVPEVETSP